MSGLLGLGFIRKLKGEFIGKLKGLQRSARGRSKRVADILTKHYLTHFRENYWLHRNLTFTRLITYKTLLVAHR